MTLRWIEGFEQATVEETSYERLYSSFTGNFTAADGAEFVDGNASLSGDVVMTTPVLVGSPAASWILGFAFRSANATLINSGSVPYVSLDNTDGEQVRLEFIQDNPANSKPGGTYYAIRLMRGASELARTVQKFPVSTSEENWTYFEFKVTIDNSTGSVAGRYRPIRAQASLSGYIALDWDSAVTSLDTQDQSSTGADRVTLSFDTGSTGVQVGFDDIYVCDTAGSKNNDYLGKIAIEGQKPSTSGGGAGATANWTLAGGATNTEDAWGEPVNTVEDDKRLTSDTTTEIHLGVVNALTSILSGASVLGVRQDLYAKMETSGDLDLTHMFRKTTGTPAETGSGTFNVSSTSVIGNAVVLEDDPNTAADWVADDLASYQHGIRNDG